MLLFLQKKGYISVFQTDCGLFGESHLNCILVKKVPKAWLVFFAVACGVGILHTAPPFSALF